MTNIWEDLKNFEYDDSDVEPFYVTPWTGHHHSEESKKAIGDANRGRVISAEGRKRMSEAHLGKSNPKSGASRKGKPLSEEHKRNKSIAAKAWWAKRKEVKV
tara:strand:+ start:209 stop:514 length:306 start_codon:yes stop_codon:yes gene_type:complete